MPNRPPPALDTLGQRIRACREELGWSQLELGEASGLRWTYVSDIERGQRNLTLRSLLRLADGLNIDAGDLVGNLHAW